MKKQLQISPSPLTERDYKNGKIGLIAGVGLHNMGANFISLTYLSAMMMMLGISTPKIALLVSANYFSGLAMGLAPYLYPYIKRPKLFLWIAIFVQTVPLSLLFTLPYFGFGEEIYVPLFAGFLLYCVVANLGTPMFSEILQIYAEHGGKTDLFYSWSSTVNNGLSFAALLVITVLNGKWEIENPRLLYFIFGITALLCFLGRLFTLSVLVREPNVEPVKSPGNLFKGIADMFADKQFRPYVVYAVCVNVGSAMITGIQTVFFVQRMGLSLKLLALLESIALLGRMAISPLLGKLSTRVNARKLFAWSILLCSFCYLLHAVMTPENAVTLRILQQIVGIVSFAGTGIFASPYMFRCMPSEEKHISYMSFIQVVSCVSAFLVGLLVSGIVEWTEGMSVTIAGISFTEMHFLHLGCAVMYLIPGLYLFSLEKKGKI